MLYRVEVIANQSVQEDIAELLEQEITDVEYTVIPTVYGKGRHTKKLGTTTWPEQNFVLFAYLNRENALKAKAIINAVKSRFKGEGISMFITQEVEI